MEIRWPGVGPKAALTRLHTLESTPSVTIERRPLTDYTKASLHPEETRFRFTIREFERGYLALVIFGDEGVWVTTDSMHIDRFEELAQAPTEVLKEF